MEGQLTVTVNQPQILTEGQMVWISRLSSALPAWMWRRHCPRWVRRLAFSFCRFFGVRQSKLNGTFTISKVRGCEVDLWQ